MAAARTKKKQTALQVHRLRPRLPGPWQYLDLLPMLQLIRNLSRDLPPAAYPLLALIVWRTVQGERKKQVAAVVETQREAIRRSQHLYVADRRPKRRSFLFFMTGR